MSSNNFRLNSDKTTFILLCPKLIFLPFAIFCHFLYTIVRDLVIRPIHDEELRHRNHVRPKQPPSTILLSSSSDSRFEKIAYYTKAVSTLIHAFVYSRIDFSNAIFFRLSSSLILKLQPIRNAYVRPILATSRNLATSPPTYTALGTGYLYFKGIE